MPFSSTPPPVTSPWGAVIQADQLAPGIWDVLCSGQGGIILSAARQEAMPEALRLDDPYYEDTCAWSLPIVAFADEPAIQRSCSSGFLQLAADTARCWHPDRIAQHTGTEVAENPSSILRTRAQYLAAIGEYCTTTAWGDWADWVPSGKVGVIARKLVSVDHLARPTYSDDEVCALIDKAIYGSRGEVTALSATPHEIIPAPDSIRPKRVA